MIHQESTIRVFDENEKQVGFKIIGSEVAVDIRGRELDQIIDNKAGEMAAEVAQFAKSVLAKQ